MLQSSNESSILPLDTQQSFVVIAATVYLQYTDWNYPPQMTLTKYQLDTQNRMPA